LSEKALLGENETYNTLQSRASNMLIMLFPVFISILTAGIFLYTKTPDNGRAMVTLIAFAIPIVFSALGCINILKPKETYNIGNIPENILKQDFFEGDEKMHQHNYMLVSQCETQQYAFDKMKELNKKNSNGIHFIIYALIISPIVAFIVYLILNYV
jgi:heme/copper-type cytochrome/quinol oxidase subunit 4